LTFEMLLNGKKRLVNSSYENQAALVCASAHQMPFMHGSFDQAVCCLATHHMNADDLLTNIHQILKPGGKLHIADAGGSSKWKIKSIRFLIKTAAFLFFLITENLSRALAESAAIGNIHTAHDWEELINIHGFVDIKINQMKSKRFWTPDPILINAINTK
jgi:ubiquinone/menaquinone biosynthesis C-methylase UbiE